MKLSGRGTCKGGRMTDGDALPRPTELPDDVTLQRVTDVFDVDTVPAGLLRAHQVASGVWGRLVVVDGTVRFVWEDDPDHPVELVGGDTLVVPPLRRHHVELGGDARFHVEFHR